MSRTVSKSNRYCPAHIAFYLSNCKSVFRSFSEISNTSMDCSADQPIFSIRFLMLFNSVEILSFCGGSTYTLGGIVLFHSFAPEIHGNTRRQKHCVCQQRSLNAKAHMICKAVGRCARFQLEHGIRHHYAAVGQPKENILHKIPCRMYRKCAPDTIHIINYKRK